MCKARIVIRTFGHKYGSPPDCAQLVFDARSIPNPYRVEGMESLTGYDRQVETYLRQQPAVTAMLTTISQELRPMIDVLISDKAQRTLVIAIGCSGGRQRSVCVARLCAREIRHWLKQRNRKVLIRLQHRDLKHDLSLEQKRKRGVHGQCH